MHLLRRTAYLHADGGRAAQPQVEQDEVRLAFAHQPPEVALAGCRADDFGFRHFGLQNLLGALELQLVVLDNDYFELFHIV